METEVIDPRPKIACLFHGDSDGFGASFALWKHLKDTCDLKFIKVQYSQPAPLAELSNFNPEKIFIVDFSYNAETLNMLESAFGQLVVIDHHKTAEADLKEWGGQYFFDKELSGCQLTWTMFSEDGLDDLPPILAYVGDRDLWKFELENSKAVNAYIATLEEDFEVWDNFYLPEACDSGRAILKFQKMQIDRRLRDVRMVQFKDLSSPAEETYYGSNPYRFLDVPAPAPPITCHLVPFVNASENISELGEAMCEAYPDSPFSVSYCDRADGQRSYSLRSRKRVVGISVAYNPNGSRRYFDEKIDQFDVSEVAKAFGGGGHPGAAGFTLSAPDII